MSLENKGPEKGAVIDTIKMIFLDDDRDSRRLTIEKFKSFDIEINAPNNIQEFIELSGNYPIILSDLNLINFRIPGSGITILLEIRKSNKISFLAIYSAFVHNISSEQRMELNRNNIKVYSKHDDLDIKNLKLDYSNWCSALAEKESAANEALKAHYNLNKEIVLKHLTQISNSTVKIPIISVKKLLSRTELIKEIEGNTELGHAFILEFIQTIAFIKNIH